MGSLSLSAPSLWDVSDNIFILSLAQTNTLPQTTLWKIKTTAMQKYCPRVLYSVRLSYIHQWWSYHGGSGEQISVLHRSVSFTASRSSISVLPTCLTSGGNPDNLVMMSLFRAYQDELVYDTRTRAHGRRQTHINTHTHAHTHTIIKK